MGVYDRAIENAKRVIKAKGELCKIIVPGTPTTDPDDPGKQIPGVEVEHLDVPIVFFPLDRVGRELLHMLRGTELITGSEYGLMGAVDFTFDITALIVRKSGERRALINADPLAPNGDNILWTLEFTK